jgi:hypothetical protein
MAMRLIRMLRERPMLVMPLFLGLYGFATVDVADYRILSAAPLSLHPDPTHQFLQFSPLAYLLGYPFTATLGATASFVIVMGGGLVLFALALRHFVAHRYGARRNDAMLMLFATPLLIVLTQYIGKSDVFTVSFLLLMASATHPLLQVALGALVIVSHFEMGLVVLASATVLGLLPWRTTIAAAVAGVFLMYGYHYALLPSVPQSRAEMGPLFLSEALDAVMATPVLHVFFTFSGFWICVLMAWPLDWRWRTALAGTAALACGTLDFTRVFNLVGLPVTIVVIDRLLSHSTEREDPRWLVALPLLPFVQAHLISGYVYDSRIPEFLARMTGTLVR